MSADPAAARPLPKPEWTSIGVWVFAWIAGLALVLAAVLLFSAAGGYPWLRAGLGFGVAVVLIVVAERWLAVKYPVSTNALDAAGIGILYATLYATCARWGIVPLPVAFVGMLLVTVAALPLARLPIRSVRAGASGPALIRALGQTGRLQLAFGIAFTIGLAIRP